MNDYSHSSELFLSELLRIASSVVWKNPQIALENEANVDSIQVEQYLLAVQGKLTFDLVYKFDIQALINAGVTSQEAALYSNNPHLIPDIWKSRCLQSQINYTIANYEEKNNYYRMLNGLPDIGDTDYVYNILYPDVSNDTTPLHLMDVSQLYSLEAKGYLQSVIEKYPDKKYLNFLTDKKISIYNARNAADFGLLWLSDSQYSSLVEDFKEAYASSRYMITSVYYNKSMSSENTEYYGFIALLILFSTINHMQYKFLDADMSRDFYDEESLRIVYDSYSVPYYQSIPVEFHKKIVKNMNILMSHKGSAKVFYDLCEIFGLNHIDLYEFYMMKSHRLDENNKPIFVRDADGNYDLEQMYDIYFAKVALNKDHVSEMTDPKNYIEYEDLTGNDPYWIDDLELRNKIYTEDYNYMQSKYIGIQTTINLMKIIYENSYYMKLIIDNREALVKTSIYNNATHSTCNIFDLIIYTCALICKKYGFAGNIPVYPHEIGKVMGFNFQQDLVTLKANISKDDYLKNDKVILQLLETMNVFSLESIKKVYGNLTELRNYLINKMQSTHDEGEYWAYYNLYNTIMYSNYTSDVFTKSDGEVADTYEELLSDVNPALYIRLSNDMDLNINDEISDMLYLIKNSCEHLKDIQYADNVNVDGIIEYLFKLLEFFKSAKCDLTSYEITYSLANKAENMMKLLSKLVVIYDYQTEAPTLFKLKYLIDLIKLTMDFSRMKDSYMLQMDRSHKISDKIFFEFISYRTEDLIKSITNIIALETVSMDMVDYYMVHDKTRLPNVKFNFEDSVDLLYDEIQTIVYRLVKVQAPMYDYVKMPKLSLILESTQLSNEPAIARISIIYDYILQAKRALDDKCIMEQITTHISHGLGKEFYSVLNEALSRILLLDEFVFMDELHKTVSSESLGTSSEIGLEFADEIHNPSLDIILNLASQMESKVVSQDGDYKFSEENNILQKIDVIINDMNRNITNAQMDDKLILLSEETEESVDNDITE